METLAGHFYQIFEPSLSRTTAAVRVWRGLRIGPNIVIEVKETRILLSKRAQ